LICARSIESLEGNEECWSSMEAPQSRMAAPKIMHSHPPSQCAAPRSRCIHRPQKPSLHCSR
jgi:hypothetical protein